MPVLRRVAGAVACLLAALASAAGAQPAPYHQWRTIETAHFRVHARSAMEREGRVAAAAAERAFEALSRELRPPRWPIDLVVSDDADYSNGSATTFPSNRIVIFATPPIESDGLRFNDDWIELVVTHELAHVFHLDRSRGVWALGQRVLGRAPFLFPNAYGPAWFIEGLAVHYESRLTGGGRLNDASQRVIARASALDGRLPHLADLSLGSPGFPGGAGVYAYGALFVDYLARTRGDSSISRFVERQSAELLPMLLRAPSRAVFGATFGEAFEQWRDSLQRAVGAARPPLPGWRELTSHAFLASNARWLNDTTLVYAGTDGRETNALFTVTTSGSRQRLGRIDSRGPAVRFPDGGLLYAQPNYVTTDEIRSDLWVRTGGDERRLTRGARLIQPDARRDGLIVAVQIEGARSTLVTVGADGVTLRTLRQGGPDETFSEPRWSTAGDRVVWVKRGRFGRQGIETMSLTSTGVRTLVEGNVPLSTPVFVRDDQSIIYVSEASGAPQLYRHDIAAATSLLLSDAPAGLASPDLSPDGSQLAVTIVRADGYHVGVAPVELLTARADSVRARTRAASATRLSGSGAQALATGAYHRYSPAQTLLPRYWYPIIESAPGGGTRVGALTSGYDVVGRHAYSAFAAVPTSGRFAVGGVGYRFSGLRRPYLDASLSQDWTSLGLLVDSGGVPRGTVLRRIQDLSFATTFARPRVRTVSSITTGIGLERRGFATDPASLVSSIDPPFGRTFLYPRALIGASWFNTQRPALSISPEDGVGVSATVRGRYRTDDASRTASASVVTSTTAYKSLDLPGFAHHVIAGRLALGLADRRTTTALEVGGTSGSTIDLVAGYALGEGRRTFGVRGFPTASVVGTSALAASLEYRAPLLLGGRGVDRIPLFFNRSSISAFADAGVAACASAPLNPSVCSAAPIIGRTIASVGAELGISLAVLEYDSPQLVRVGLAVPVASRALINRNVANTRPASVYVAFGFAF